MAWAELVLRAAGCSSVVLVLAAAAPPPGAGFESTTAAATARLAVCGRALGRQELERENSFDRSLWMRHTLAFRLERERAR